jgi:hypothetical protein
MSRKLKRLLPLLILSVTSACGAGSTAPAALNDYCAITKPIEYDSVKDTPETVKAVEEHNSKWACVCDHDCPVKP